jgi:hypothetical protein
MSTQPERSRDADAGARRRSRALAVAGGVAGALAVWAVGEPLLGHDLVVKQPAQPERDLGAAAMAVFALVPGLLGWSLLAGLERVTRRAGAIWTAVALLVLAVSFVPLINVEATAGTRIVLALAHLVVAAAVVPVFWRTSTSDRRPVPAAEENR